MASGLMSFLKSDYLGHMPKQELRMCHIAILHMCAVYIVCALLSLLSRSGNALSQQYSIACIIIQVPYACDEDNQLGVAGSEQSELLYLLHPQ